MFSSWTDKFTIHHQLSMQHYRHVQKRGGPVCAIDVVKRYMLHHALSPSCEFYNTDQVTSSMTPSNTDVNYDFMQVVYDIIDNLLIDKAV